MEISGFFLKGFYCNYILSKTVVWVKTNFNPHLFKFICECLLWKKFFLTSSASMVKFDVKCMELAELPRNLIWNIWYVLPKYASVVQLPAACSIHISWTRDLELKDWEITMFFVLNLISLLKFGIDCSAKRNKFNVVICPYYSTFQNIICRVLSL